MDAFKNWVGSFRFNEKHFHTLVIEFVYWVVVVLLFGGVLMYLNKLGFALMGGRSPEAFQQYFFNLPAEQIQAFSGDIQTFTVLLIASIVLLPVLGVLLFSLSRSVVWSSLFGKVFDFKKHWKWNLVTLALIPVLVLVALLFVVVRSLFSLFSFSLTVGSRVDAVVLLLCLTLFVLLMVVTHKHFFTHRKVWASVQSAFRFVWSKKGVTTWFFGFLTIFILQVVQLPFANWLFVHVTFNMYLNAVLFLLWFVWLRVYIVDISK